MATFVRTTDAQSGAVGFVNLDLVQLMLPCEDGSTYVKFAHDGKHVTVKEPVDEILGHKHYDPATCGPLKFQELQDASAYALTALRDLHMGYPSTELAEPITDTIKRLRSILRSLGNDDEGGWDLGDEE